MTTEELVSLGLSVFAVGVGFVIFWCVMAGMLLGTLAVLRSTLGVGRG